MNLEEFIQLERKDAAKEAATETEENVKAADEKASVAGEKDPSALTKWLKLAAKSQNLQDFMAKAES